MIITGKFLSFLSEHHLPAGLENKNAFPNLNYDSKTKVRIHAQNSLYNPALLKLYNALNDIVCYNFIEG